MEGEQDGELKANAEAHHLHRSGRASSWPNQQESYLRYPIHHYRRDA
jgi:hypothetical protein